MISNRTKRTKKIAVAVVFIALAVAATTLITMVQHGFSARDEPLAIEAFVARRLRRFAVPRGAREMQNPIPATPEILAEARAHFADHCAICHANDGSGQTQIGQNLYPKAPDMREPRTQALSDGELFYIIHNGIRLTGMPAWGDGNPDDDEGSWELVHFIRHLPELTDEELEDMRNLNPKSRHECFDGERFIPGTEAMLHHGNQRGRSDRQCDEHDRHGYLLGSFCPVSAHSLYSPYRASPVTNGILRHPLFANIASRTVLPRSECTEDAPSGMLCAPDVRTYRAACRAHFHRF
jgi:mono/diheme cytochrome c family protein